MSNGLTTTGFDVNSLTQNILEYQTGLQNAYNNPRLSIEDNEHLGQLIKLIADRETKVWQAIKQVYHVWTLNGAESIFLDELFALNGVFRKAATAGVGDAVVQVDRTALNTTEVIAGTIFNGENGIAYATSTSQLISSRVTAYRINGALTSLNTYNLTITNNDTDEVFTSSHTLAAADNTSRLNFLTSVKNALDLVNPSETNSYIDSTNLVLYWGFDEAYELRGLQQDVEFLSTPTLGNRYALIEVTATTTGFNPLGVGEIATMTPLPDGYVSVTNLTQFSDGTDVETDAAFIERARTVTDSPRSSTRAAIIAGLLTNVEGVQRALIQKEVVDGIVEVTPIIIGGATAAIAQELYRTQPINNQYIGTESYQVDTEDESTETIRFSRGTSQQMSIRVTYSTVNGTALTDTETSQAISNLLDTSEEWGLGRQIFNFSLLSSVSNAVASNRFSTLLVEIKKLEDPDSSYSSANYTPDITELPDLIEDNITFVRVL
jgi:hypothetical protein